MAWRVQNERLTHSTPVLATVAGVRQVIFATQKALISLSCTNGALLWRQPYPFSYDTSLAASPVVYSNIVFISANYSMGSFATQVALESGNFVSTPLWTNAAYKAHWMTPVCYQDYLYGQFGSAANSPLKCIDLLTGLEKWSVNGFGRGGTILVGNRLLTLTERGDFVLMRPDPERYTELARWSVFPGCSPSNNKCWNVPAVCDGNIYARSTARGGLRRCRDTGAEDAGAAVLGAGQAPAFHWNRNGHAS